MKSSLFLPVFMLSLTLLDARAFATETRPVFRSTSNNALTVYSVERAELIDQYFDPNRLFASFAIVRLTGTYESNCASVELSAHLMQSMSGEELLSEFSLRDVKGPSEAVAVEPKICTSLTKPKNFDVQLQFQPNYFDQVPGVRKWRIATKYGPTGAEHEYGFGITLDSTTGFSITQ